MSATPIIGTLNEGSIHQALKARYATPRSVLEQEIDGFVADLVDGDRIIEIQTAGFGAMKRKLPHLLERHAVTLVHPIAEIRHIVKLAQSEDAKTTRRRSPKRGSLFDVFSELVSIPTLLEHENLTLDIVMTEEDELRAYDGKRGRRKGGWVVVGRRLIDVLCTYTVRSMDDLFDMVEAKLPSVFTTADLSAAMGRPRRTGQQAAYCFRCAGVAEICDKRGNTLVYRRC